MSASDALPPLFPALTALWRGLFGEGLAAIRLAPALSGAALVVLTALLVRELGGRRLALTFASLALLAAPIFLALHSLHTMNQLEPLLWTGGAIVLAKIARGGDGRLWLLFGAISGIGLLDKSSMAFFGAAVAPALVATRERRTLRTRWPYLGGAVATHARIGSPLLTHTLFGVYLGVLAWAGLALRNPKFRNLIAN